jgi:hypothetical protein
LKSTISHDEDIIEKKEMQDLNGPGYLDSKDLTLVLSCFEEQAQSFHNQYEKERREGATLP